LLTQRIREAAGPRFAMHVLQEGAATADGTHVREIDMGCGAEVWLFAHTRVPAATLAAQPWLGSVGRRRSGAPALPAPPSPRPPAGPASPP
jgi:chorismate-pyruvate lyase